VLLPLMDDGGEGVHDPQVGVGAHSQHQEDGAVQRVAVEIVAVVEAAVAAADVSEGLRDLVGQVVVHGGEHEGTSALRATAAPGPGASRR
jgi:hypothetical protein